MLMNKVTYAEKSAAGSRARSSDDVPEYCTETESYSIDFPVYRQLSEMLKNMLCFKGKRLFRK